MDPEAGDVPWCDANDGIFKDLDLWRRDEI